MNRVKKIFKPIVLRLAKLLQRFFEWITLPYYASKHNLILRRVGVRPVISSSVLKDFNSLDESLNTLDLIISIISEQNIPYFVYSTGYYNKSVGIMSEHRDAAINLLGNSSKLKEYYYRVQRERLNTNAEKIMGNGIPSNDKKNSTLCLYLFRNVSLSRNKFLNGKEFETRVEFWSKPEDLSETMLQRALSESGIMERTALEGSIVAPIPNGIVKVVAKSEQEESTITLGDKTYPTIKMFDKDFLHEVNFPIDIVYTWVDGSDEKWMSRYEAARKEIEPDYKNNSMARYTDHDELKYSLRSIEMYAPWVRNIYIVTDDQTPEWLLQDQDRVKIVTHKEIFNNPSVLPVFNSHAIESQLHHIPDLSEHYLYLNDDMMFARPVRPDTFFFPNGIAKTQPSQATIGSGEPSHAESAPSFAGKNARKIVLSHSGKYITNKYRHTACPQIKSTAYSIENSETEYCENTMKSKFRSSSDIPFTSVLMQSYMTATRQGAALPIPASTVNVSLPSSEEAMSALLNYQQPYFTVCLNESITEASEEALVEARVHRFLEEFLPYASPWEILESKSGRVTN